MTGRELLAFARSKMGTAYVYGMKGTRMSESDYTHLKNRYGSVVWESDKNKIGQICVDCSGLISWATGVVLGSAQLYERAGRREHISTIKTAPIGALVWRRGHVGIYAGLKNNEPYYIAADGSQYGVREVPLSRNSFTHWMLMDNMDYQEEEAEMVTKDTIIVDGREYRVDMIRKDDVTYIKTRDIASAIGAEVSHKGRIPVITTK